MTEKEVQALIDKAIAKHNREASLISAAIGSILLFFYADGIIRIVDLLK